MTKVEALQIEIESLSPTEYFQFRNWFTERDWEKWDQQLERDIHAGKLNFLMKEALEEKRKGNLREL